MKVFSNVHGCHMSFFDGCLDSHWSEYFEQNIDLRKNSLARVTVIVIFNCSFFQSMLQRHTHIHDEICAFKNDMKKLEEQSQLMNKTMKKERNEVKEVFNLFVRRL